MQKKLFKYLLSHTNSHFSIMTKSQILQHISFLFQSVFLMFAAFHTWTITALKQADSTILNEEYISKNA